MREIKFRGKPLTECNKPNGMGIAADGWAYGNLVQGDDGEAYITGDCIESTEEYFSLEWWVPVDPATVEQYTNQDDADKTEIYGGDFVMHYDCEKVFCLVDWHKNGWYLWNYLYGKWQPARPIDWAEDYRVIGNTTDNSGMMMGGRIDGN